MAKNFEEVLGQRSLRPSEVVELKLVRFLMKENNSATPGFSFSEHLKLI